MVDTNVGKYGKRIHVEASRAFDVHEERVRALDEALKFVFAGLRLGRWEQQVLSELR